MIRRPPRSTHCISSAASDVYKRQPPSVGVVASSRVPPGVPASRASPLRSQSMHAPVQGGTPRCQPRCWSRDSSLSRMKWCVGFFARATSGRGAVRPPGCSLKALGLPIIQSIDALLAESQERTGCLKRRLAAAVRSRMSATTTPTPMARGVASTTSTVRSVPVAMATRAPMVPLSIICS